MVSGVGAQWLVGWAKGTGFTCLEKKRAFIRRVNRNHLPLQVVLALLEIMHHAFTTFDFMCCTLLVPDSTF